jgi:glycine/D-amino acid oxidase-like deaminating enzyme
MLVAAGHYRNGVLLAAITGQLIAHLIVDRAPRWPIDARSTARFV